MLSKLIQAIFVPKRARAKLARAKMATPKSRPPAVGATSASGGGTRDKLLDDTMALYRRQRQDVYESLDEDTKRRIEEDAEKAFGKALRSKG